MSTTSTPQELRILIVEDQGVMRALLRDFLQSNLPGVAISEAADGARALQLAAERRPRVVVMDIYLPDTSGIDLIMQIKALLPSTQVIVVTHLQGGNPVERAFAAGATAYLTTEKILTDLLPLVLTALSPTQGSR